MGQQVYSLARLAQPLMVISLFLIFVKLFAWDAVKRFNREEVMVQVEMEEAESLDTPAVTICASLVSNLSSIPSDIDIYRILEALSLVELILLVGIRI